jgi:hypothetical protein
MLFKCPARKLFFFFVIAFNYYGIPSSSRVHWGVGIIGGGKASASRLKPACLKIVYLHHPALQ